MSHPHTMAWFLWIVLASTVLLHPLRGQSIQEAIPSVDETWAAACSSKIEPPSYPDDALRSRVMGSVAADFEIAESGKAAHLTTQGPAQLAEAVQAAIASTEFPTPCGGRNLQVAFSFNIASDVATGKLVCFTHPPNRFWITAERTDMACGSHYSFMTALVAPGGMKPITVCELLAHPTAYDGKNIALLGRWADSKFDGVWLSEDNCGSTLVSEGHVWPNEVWIGGGTSGPMPPLGLLLLDPVGLTGKLESVHRTTSLKMEEETLFHKDGTVTHELVRQHWAVIFGRIEARKELRPPRGTPSNRDWGNGFGHMNAAPVQIIANQENEFFIPDAVPGKMSPNLPAGGEVAEK